MNQSFLAGGDVAMWSYLRSLLAELTPEWMQPPARDAKEGRKPERTQPERHGKLPD
jgi:hypothetical protein